MAEWAQTSHILALLANVNRDPKKRSRAYRPGDYNPYPEARQAEKKRNRIVVDDMGSLKGMFEKASKRWR